MVFSGCRGASCPLTGLDLRINGRMGVPVRVFSNRGRVIVGGFGLLGSTSGSRVGRFIRGSIILPCIRCSYSSRVSIVFYLSSRLSGPFGNVNKLTASSKIITLTMSGSDRDGLGSTIVCSPVRPGAGRVRYYLIYYRGVLSGPTTRCEFSVWGFWVRCKSMGISAKVSGLNGQTTIQGHRGVHGFGVG